MDDVLVCGVLEPLPAVAGCHWWVKAAVMCDSQRLQDALGPLDAATCGVAAGHMFKHAAFSIVLMLKCHMSSTGKMMDTCSLGRR